MNTERKKLVKKVKKSKSKRTLQSERCNDMWREIVYLRAGGKSEISGQPTEKGSRNAHHAWGKSTLALKYDTRNGINLTPGEHSYGIHSHDPSIVKQYQERIENVLVKREGSNILTILDAAKRIVGSNLDMIEIALKHQLTKLKESK